MRKYQVFIEALEERNKEEEKGNKDVKQPENDTPEAEPL